MSVDTHTVESSAPAPDAAPSTPDAAAEGALVAAEEAQSDRIELRQDIDAANKPAATQDPALVAPVEPSSSTPTEPEAPENEASAEEQSFSDSISTFYNSIKMSGGGTLKAVLATVGFAFSLGPTKLWNFLKKAFSGEEEKDEDKKRGNKPRPSTTPSEGSESSLGKTLAENIQALLKEFNITETADARKNYFLIAVELAKEVQAKFGIPYQVCVAQSCLETGFGTSDLVARSFNAFGLRKNGEYVKFSSLRDSFMGYGTRLTTNKIYKKAFEYKDDPARFLEEVKAAGYAEDPGYVGKVRVVAKSYGLSF